MDPAGPSRIREIGPNYISGENNLADDLFLPCLSSCTSYWRASGFFSSKVLLSWSTILEKVVHGDPTDIRLLISPILHKDDIDALRTATSEESRALLRNKKADRLLAGLFDEEHSGSHSKLCVDLFSWLVANERMLIRFAFPEHTAECYIFHEKYGVFFFPDGDKVAFTGSANETLSGYQNNYESVDVYRSWIPEECERVDRKATQFNEAWAGRARGLKTEPMSTEIFERLVARAPAQMPMLGMSKAAEKSTAARKWRHQDEAIKAFIAKRAGVIEMATGTGKTRVALRILRQLLEENEINSAIITTRGNDLLDQWFFELAQLASQQGMAVYRHYGNQHELGRYMAHVGGSVLLVSTGALHKALKNLDAEQARRVFVVHDEVHGFGSPGSVQKLRDLHGKYRYRLGLSATPEREYDEEGSSFINEEIGEVVYEFGLKAAISRGILCEFEYMPLEYELTESDKRRLRDVYAAKSARQREGKPMPDAELFRLLADVYKTAEEKPQILRDYFRRHPELLRSTIIFAHTKEYASQVVEAVHAITPNYSTYFDDDQKEILRKFGRGELDCLITCHRISQGIDIRQLENVVLMSSDRARLETIQRIGRCLRVDPDNPQKKARVIDFVRTSDSEGEPNADQSRRDWLTEVSQQKRDNDAQ